MLFPNVLLHDVVFFLQSVPFVCVYVVKMFMDECCFSFQFDEEFLNRQEAQSQAVKYEEKIAELQAELQAVRSQVTAIILFNSLRASLLCAEL